jgi:hypothetical protein
MTQRVNRGFVEKLQVVRDEYEAILGHSPVMDKMVHDALKELVHVSKDASTRRWAEGLVPSGILDAHDDVYDTFKPEPNSEVDDALAPVNPFSNPSQFPVFVSALPSSISSSSRRRKTAASGRRGGKTRKNKSIRRRKH